MKVIPCTMILNATSAEHLAKLIRQDMRTFGSWLAYRLAENDDDSDRLVLKISFAVEQDHPHRLFEFVKELLLRDCQQVIAEYLDEELSRDLNEDDYYDSEGQRIVEEDDYESVAA
jgi:hypothetical protein